jgi:hypothetical protein
MKKFDFPHHDNVTYYTRVRWNGHTGKWNEMRGKDGHAKHENYLNLLNSGALGPDPNSKNGFVYEAKRVIVTASVQYDYITEYE